MTLRAAFLISLIVMPGLALLAQDEAPTQITPQNRSGELPFSAAVGTDVEHVDIAGGNLVVNIPILHSPGRGMNYNFDLTWDARFWVEATRGGASPFELWNIEQRGYLPQFNNGLWATNMPRVSYVSYTKICNDNDPDAPNHVFPGNVFGSNSYIYHDASGAKHPLSVDTEFAECEVGSYNIDNSRGPDLTGAGMLGVLNPAGGPFPVQIDFSDGTGNLIGGPGGATEQISQTAFESHTGAAGYLDVYGNIKWEREGGTDTLGRVMVNRTDPGPNQTVFSVYDVNGIQRSYTINYVDVPIHTSFNLSSMFGGLVREYSGTRKEISSVILPNGLSYQFQYDSFGYITQITLPSGATVQYSWAIDPVVDRVRYVSSRTLTVSGQSSTWTFTRAAGAADECAPSAVNPSCKKITVTDPQQNQTVYVRTGTSSGPNVTRVRIYQGAPAGMPLREYVIDYLSDPNGSSLSLPTSITTTLENGLVSRKEFTYDEAAFDHLQCIMDQPFFCTQDNSLIHNMTVLTTRGNVLSVKEYDWGQGVPGPLLRTTTNDYLHDANSLYIAPNIVSRIIRQTVLDPNGTIVAKTEYQYDNATTTGPFRGSVTQVGRWRNTDNVMLNTTYAYDAFGNVTSMTDPSGHSTSWSYADRWPANQSNCLPGANSAAFVSQRTNAKGQRVQITRSPCTGQVVQHKGENDILAGGDGTAYAYDLMNRLLTVTDSMGGQTSQDYHADALPLNITTTQLIATGVNRLSTSVHDALGRITQSQLVMPGGTANVDTVFDSLGRTTSVSNPYFSANEPTYGLVQSQYDALGRLIQVTQQDNSLRKISYSGNCTVTADEAGTQRRSCSDALGRLVEVDEPNPGAAPTAATGWVSIGGAEQMTNTTVAISVANSGFETPALGTGNFQYSPVGGSWTFSAGSGLSANGSGFTSGNPIAPQGAQVAFVQGGSTSVVSQSLSGFQSGVSYTVSFKAAQRANASQGGQDFDVYLDSTPLGTFRPGSGSYGALSTAAFTTTAGSHTLKFVGRDSSGGDNTAFIDAVQVTGVVGTSDTGTVTVLIDGTPYVYNYGAGDNTGTVAAGLAAVINAGSLAQATSFANADVPVANSGFEAPGLSAGSFQYNPGGGNWTFSGGSGVSANGSGFTGGNPAAIQGTQVAFLQGGYTSVISQSLSGFQAGVSYTVSFYAAQRANFNQGGEDFDVYLDATRLGTFQPGSVAYGGQSTVAFSATAGSHTLKFVGRNTLGGDNTAFIDAVRVTAAGGSTVILTSNAKGSAVSYTLTASGTHSANFTQPSFIATPSAAGLTGGMDTGNINNNPYVTQYSYDILGNLTSVNQIGDGTAPRVRTFTYNSLAQLLTAYNPESGQIIYRYDPDGNLWQKTSPAPNQIGADTQTISYCYDELHRVTGRAYSAQNCSNGQLPLGTAVVSYVYDTATNGVGHLAQMTDLAGTATYSYDILGRLASETRTLPGISGSQPASVGMTMSYDYYLDGSLKALHYPGGSAVTYTPDSGGVTVSAIDKTNSASPINYVTGATYSPTGAIAGFVSGNGITSSFSYNNRLQPVNMSAVATQMSPVQTVFSLGYDFHLGSAVVNNGDNGNVYGITNFKDSTRSQTFAYDALNRLISAQNAGTDCAVTILNNDRKFWGNDYVYDPWGNLLQKNKKTSACYGENLLVTVDNRNRISSSGFAYDAPGNLTNDGLGHAYTYDQENRITGAAGYTYTYDGDGNRVKKANGTAASSGTLYWYMAPGVVAESDLAGTLTSEYVFFNGERVARRDLPSPESVSYYFSDYLKTASVITDAVGNIKAESDYFPWGGELQFVNNDSNHYKFTGKERDSETQLDYFGARYYSNRLGKFITPDWAAKSAVIPYAVLGDPQSFNLYTYVRNIPTTALDPDGHQCGPGSSCEAMATHLAQWFGAAAARDGGVKPAAKNTGIGLAKGGGQFAAALAWGLADKVVPGGGAALLLTKAGMQVGNAVLPSNQTQAEAAPVGVAIASTAVTMALSAGIGALEGAELAPESTFVFRGDDMPHSVAFGQGFTARGTSTDLLAHALDNTSPPSAFVPTSASPTVAEGFGQNVYVIRPVNGIDVNQALGASSPFPGELEIAIPRGIAPGDIRAVTIPSRGVSILNPNWQP